MLLAFCFAEGVAIFPKADTEPNYCKAGTEKNDPQSVVQPNLRTDDRAPPKPEESSGRDSTQCVQWRNAVAAETQARYTTFGFWLLTLTLGFTAWAAVSAKRAATATHESALAGNKAAEAARSGLNLSKRMARQQTIDSRRSQELSRQSANAAARSAKVAEDALRGIERPYLFPYVTGSFLINNPRRGSTIGRSMWPNAEVKFTNYGRIPAIPLVLDLEFDHLTVLPDELPHMANIVIDPNTVIRPEGETGIFRKDMPLLDDAAVDSILNGRSFIWFYGCLTYLAPTGDEHETAFCWFYNGLTGRFGPYYQHNRIT